MQHHPAAYRALAITSLAMALLLTAGWAAFWWDFLKQVSAGNPMFVGTMMALRIIQLGVVCPVCLIVFWSGWCANRFSLNGFRLQGTILEISGVMPGQSRTIELARVRRVIRFVVFGPSLTSAGAKGLRLELASGHEVIFSEALAMWPDILAQCGSAEVISEERPWWLPTSSRG